MSRSSSSRIGDIRVCLTNSSPYERPHFFQNLFSDYWILTHTLQFENSADNKVWTYFTSSLRIPLPSNNPSQSKNNRNSFNGISERLPSFLPTHPLTPNNYVIKELPPDFLLDCTLLPPNTSVKRNRHLRLLLGCTSKSTVKSTRMA